MTEKIQVKTTISTDWGNFFIIAFAENDIEKMPHLALYHQNTDFSKTVNVRIHSECMTGDVFHSKRCDCGKQLDFAMNYFAQNGGILLYLRQEGRGIGLINKLKAYNLQDEGMNTAEANEALGFGKDERDFSVAIRMLETLHIKSINLLTNNPEKMKVFNNSSVQVVERISVKIKSEPENESYLNTKKDVFGHWL